MPMSPRLLRPKAASGFDPRSITGLLAWYDVADMSTLFQNSNGTTAATAENDPVGYLKDKGPSGYHMTQSTNNARPLLKLAAQNGRPALLFDGTNDFLFNATTFLNTLTPTVVFVAQRESDNPLSRTNQVHAAIATGRAGVSGEVAYSVTLRNSFVSPQNAVRIAADVTARRNGNASVETGSSPTAFMIGGGAGTSGGNSVNVQNSGDGVSLGATRDAAGLMGSSFTNAFWLHGRIGELVVYSRVLSLSEMQSLERYLSAKWGIALTP